jgi:two-component system sensor histidine kinase KdpD
VVPAILVGIALLAVVGTTLGSWDGVSRATQALLLVVPVVGCAVLGGRWPALAAVGGATLVFSLLIPPVGSPRVELADDAVALGVFTLVALAIGELVSRRVDALAQLERHRRALLRSVSHDLRTPLSTVKAAVTSIVAGGERPATEQRLLEIVVDETDRLDRLVANLLSLSRIEAGALHPHLGSVDLAELVTLCAHRLGGRSADVTCTVQVEEGLPAVPADFALIDQVVTNLLENALRHSPHGGTVGLVVSSGRSTVRLDVVDHGPGVAPTDREHIFEPFRSGSPAATSGIGLAICRAVVEAHRGTIRVGDTPGGGATFTVELPA